jgi:hypothetical protein
MSKTSTKNNRTNVSIDQKLLLYLLNFASHWFDFGHSFFGLSVSPNVGSGLFRCYVIRRREQTPELVRYEHSLIFCSFISTVNLTDAKFLIYPNSNFCWHRIFAIFIITLTYDVKFDFEVLKSRVLIPRTFEDLGSRKI